MSDCNYDVLAPSLGANPDPAWIYSPPFNRGLQHYRVRLTPAG